MCKAFSCIVMRSARVLWKLGVDSHSDILTQHSISDTENDPEKLEFARVEITPNNGSHFEPDDWTLRIDQAITPLWWDASYVAAAWEAHAEWLTALNKILIHKSIVHPFDVLPPKRITKKHLRLLREWASVRGSVEGDIVRGSVEASVEASVGGVGGSVWDSVGNVGESVRGSVRTIVRGSVEASVGSVGVSVWVSVWAYIGSFFNLPSEAWLYTKRVKNKGYPFQPAVDLWELGLLPSFDGKTWRLHGGPKAAILWSGTVVELEAACGSEG